MLTRKTVTSLPFLAARNLQATQDSQAGIVTSSASLPRNNRNSLFSSDRLKRHSNLSNSSLKPSKGSHQQRFRSSQQINKMTNSHNNLRLNSQAAVAAMSSHLLACVLMAKRLTSQMVSVA